MSDTESNHFADPAVWLVVFLFGLLLYVFAYPVVLILLDSAFNITSIDAIEPVITITFVPLKWLIDAVPVYEAYVDFLEDRLLK